MKKSFKNTTYKIPLKYHLIFWISYYILNVIRWGSYYQDYWYSIKSNLVTVTLGMLLAYFHVYFLLPKFLFRRKVIQYILIFILALIVFYIVRTELIFLYINENVWPESQTPQKAYAFNHILVVFLIGVYDVALATTIKLTVDWIFDKRRIERLQAEKLKTELQFLKSQIQPHFFFNTLNSLYALTLEKSDIAPKVVLKLSNIMQYVIYDVKEAKVKLLKEVNYIKDYLDLERLRFGKKIDLNVNIIGDISKIKVPSLLYLTFIENCFKHSGKIDGFYVNITFENKNNTSLLFTVENNYKEYNEVNNKSGIGHKNIKRRLDLLFADKYYLHISNNTNIYKVELEIPINLD